MRVVGIDPSLTSTGVARVERDGTLEVSVRGRRGTRGETLVDRFNRLEDLVGDIAALGDWAQGDLVVIEGPSYGSIGAGSVDRNGLWWLLVRRAFLAGATVALVAPSTRAKWATGKGNADKAAVASAVTRLLPEVTIKTSDAADAVVLALMGAQSLGWRPDLDGVGYRTSAIATIAWGVSAW